MSRMSITVDISDLLTKYDGERQKARDAADQLVAKVTTEDRAFTKDEEAELKAHQDKIVDLTKRSELLKKQAEVRAGLEEPGKPKTQRDVKPRERADDDEESEAKDREKRYSKAFGSFIRRGIGAISEEERTLLQSRFNSLPSDHPEVRDLSAITGAAGGFTVPTGFLADIEKGMKDYSGVLQSNAQVINTDTGADLPWPTVNDTANEGEQVEENQAVGGQDVAFGQITAKAYLFSSKLVLVPQTLIQDTGINVEQVLAELLAERLGRIANRRLTTGNGANQPQGVATASTLGVTAAGAAAITYDETIDLEHAVDPAHRVNAEYMFHDDCLKLLRKLKDSDGRPIWMPAANAAMANGAPGLLNNRPYRINMHMDSPASGKRSMLFGDFRKYKIRRVKNITLVRLAERYAEKLQIGFFAFMRLDGRLSNAGTNPIKHLVHP